MDELGKNICVIGGGGFIGTSLREYLSYREFKIYTIGRSLNIPTFANEEYYSILEYPLKQLKEVFKGVHFTAIIDLAYTSLPNTSFVDPIKDFSENLYNAINNLDFARVINVQKYVYVSSGGTVYGESNYELFSEDAPNFPLSPYGVTKLACERYVYMYHRLHNLPAVIVRPSNIYGPRQQPFRGQGLISTALGLALKGESIHVFGDGSQVRDYLYIEDFIRGLIDVIDLGEPGKIYNIGSGHGLSVLDLIKEINLILKEYERSLSITYLPERPFDVNFNVLNIQQIGQLRGWNPEVSLRSGIINTWEWIKDYLVNLR